MKRVVIDARPAISTPVDGRSKRPLTQYSFRSLLLTITILSLFLGVLVDKSRRQRHAVMQIRAMGGWVAYDWQKLPHQGGSPPGPRWFREIFGDDFFQNVTEVTFWNAAPPDLTPLADCPRLRGLSIPWPEVRDVSTLAGLSELEWLCLSKTKISDLSSLKKLHKLKHLFLDDTLVNDLHDLYGATQLEELWICNTPISDEEAMRFQRRVPNCEIVRTR